jgi:hypothetical protein
MLLLLLQLFVFAVVNVLVHLFVFSFLSLIDGSNGVFFLCLWPKEGESRRKRKRGGNEEK